MTDDFETAEKFGQGRALYAPFLGLLILVAQQGIFFAWDWGDDSLLQIALWLVFAVAMLMLLMTGGGIFLSKRARELANDEVTQLNRLGAIQAGFVVAMVMGFLVWAISPFEPLHAQRAANFIVSTSLASAFIAFGVAEMRTQAGGA